MKKTFLGIVLVCAVLFSGCVVDDGFTVIKAQSVHDDNAFYFSASSNKIIKIEKGDKINGYVDEDEGIVLRMAGEVLVDYPFNNGEEFKYECSPDIDGETICYFWVNNIMSGDASVKLVIEEDIVRAIFVSTDGAMLGKVILNKDTKMNLPQGYGGTGPTYRH